jgi:bacterioferritin
MQAKPGVIDALNTILSNELTAINQYFIQAEICKDWGYELLHGKLRELSFGEMKEAQLLIRHILYLEGMPNLQRLGRVRVGENALEHLTVDVELEKTQIQALADGIILCQQVNDFTTRGILEELIRAEEEDLNLLETQLETIKQIGLEQYLAQQIHED